MERNHADGFAPEFDSNRLWVVSINRLLCDKRPVTPELVSVARWLGVSRHGNPLLPLRLQRNATPTNQQPGRSTPTLGATGKCSRLHLRRFADVQLHGADVADTGADPDGSEGVQNRKPALTVHVQR